MEQLRNNNLNVYNYTNQRHRRRPVFIHIQNIDNAEHRSPIEEKHIVQLSFEMYTPKIKFNLKFKSYYVIKKVKRHHHIFTNNQVEVNERIKAAEQQMFHIRWICGYSFYSYAQLMKLPVGKMKLIFNKNETKYLFFYFDKRNKNILIPHRDFITYQDNESSEDYEHESLLASKHSIFSFVHKDYEICNCCSESKYFFPNYYIEYINQEQAEDDSEEFIFEYLTDDDTIENNLSDSTISVGND